MPSKLATRIAEQMCEYFPSAPGVPVSRLAKTVDAELADVRTAVPTLSAIETKLNALSPPNFDKEGRCSLEKSLDWLIGRYRDLQSREETFKREQFNSDWETILRVSWEFDPSVVMTAGDIAESIKDLIEVAKRRGAEEARREVRP